mgnify:CR=1 FL=1
MDFRPEAWGEQASFNEPPDRSGQMTEPQTFTLSFSLDMDAAESKRIVCEGEDILLPDCRVHFTQAVLSPLSTVIAYEIMPNDPTQAAAQTLARRYGMVSLTDEEGKPLNFYNMEEETNWGLNSETGPLFVEMMLPESDEQLFAEAYDETAGGDYTLTEVGYDQREDLDEAMALPLSVVHYADQIPDLDLDQAKAAFDAGLVSKDDVMSMLDESRESLGDMADTLIAQQGIAAARAEYEQLGVDMDAMQMDYLAATGAKMLGLAALGMVIAVMVGFLASRTAAKVGRSLRERLFNQVVGFSDAEIQSFSAASLITRGTNDVQLVQMVTVIAMTLRPIIESAIPWFGKIPWALLWACGVLSVYSGAEMIRKNLHILEVEE